MDNRDFFEMVADIFGAPTVGQKLMLEFTDDDEDDFHNGIDALVDEYADDEWHHRGIRSGMYYSQYIRLAVYMEWKYSITSNKDIRTHHVYELLEFLRQEGFKEATLKGYISAVRHVYSNNTTLFSDEFELPNNAGYAQYRSES